MKIERYDIRLDLSSPDLKYTGAEKIKFSETPHKLSLDSVGLTVSSVKGNGKELKYQLDETAGKLNVENPDLSPEIEVQFSGKVEKSLIGMYYADYPGGRMISTQFESTGARMVFPCFDEPEYKAVFGITLLIPADKEAISNGSIKSKVQNGNVSEYVFNDTPRMSTYLVYIGIADFESRKIQRKGKDIILAGPRGTLAKSNLALEIASKSLDFFEKYFGIDYAMPKMHLVGVPEFAFGAMENWGAISFRNIALYVDENSSSYIQGRVAIVIAHEIAHQWFGDLVTMKWWNDIWLNESFATLMEYKAVDSFFPEKQIFNDFLNDPVTGYYGAMIGDTLKNTHPIESNLKTPEEIMQVFDEISYGKGGAILRMIDSYVGEENFRKGVSAYLKRFSYSNAKGEDLWNHISEASGMEIGDVIRHWVTVPGYPVITVSKIGDEIVLKQGKFTYYGVDHKETWPVPLTVIRESGVESMLFDKGEIRIPASGFIKLNHNQSGFYRVQYSTELFRSITKRLDKIGEKEIWGMVSDLYAFLLSGSIDLPTFITDISAFTSIESPLVVGAIARELSSLLDIRVDDAKLYDFAIRFIREKFAKISERKSGESDTISILRETLSSILSRTDDEFAREFAGKFEDLEKSDPNLRRAISTSFARIKDDPEALLKKMGEVTAEEDRIKIISAMGWVGSDSSRNKVIKMIADEKIRRQDFVYVLGSMAINKKGRKYFVGIYREQMENIRKVFASTIYPTQTIEMTAPYLGLADEKKIREVLKEIAGPDITAGINKGLEYLDVYSRIRDLKH
ncbi:MAG: M1 family metallopeptidase [Candidatus Thermoplasmatota archaeon]|nr:M1 family metallopeptidase [Candidatus Thermoplasmatota archaeon]MCL5438140.1 M1 family metallopeptidase [Candidatus Thermoplasmatota archaeon]